MKFEYLSNSELSHLIDEWVKNERDRRVLKRRLIDGICFEPLAEEQNMSVQNVHRIIDKYSKIIAEKCRSA